MNVILTTVSRVILPFIIAFSFYIQINGSDAPGGGFQAGVLMASAIILYSMVFSHERTMQIISTTFVKFLAVTGIMLYGGTGIVCMIQGGEFLNYNALQSRLGLGQVIGISVVEWGVGLTVFATVYLAYIAFATRGRHE